jgi:hypothetical protein
MRVTIIPVDGFVSVDGMGLSGLDLSFMDVSVHAVQWYETHGEIEVKDPATGRMIANEVITSIDAFQPAIDAWQVVKTAQEAAELAFIAARDNQPVTTGSQTL